MSPSHQDTDTAGPVRRGTGMRTPGIVVFDLGEVLATLPDLYVSLAVLLPIPRP
jgi:hypothetical protein